MKTQTLQIIDSDGKTVLFEADLGSNEGEWNIHNEDEAQDLLYDIRCHVDEQDEQPSEDS